ncbi:MAG: SDR family oxidoreductase [Flavobacteriales bacterium]|jgi:NAD(P)-dependent dehydrogenase (short-subunit alcohol dehydrogenase family)|nr:SDR family oxidoreductase [Flavobacteriales bacterium]MBK6894519.1 SDR family oxidoreductase [Flavobacteriales bacterium]MBK7248450.1 SDR family oxidoreductase [Flavobacteriales bacterium]MBK9059331.1 SDR family oxidoreductase [Flavobacteriales bacterium]MBK9597728.1 SDR family oxidoreductase [Flavobacteriales bacterium]
MSPTSKVVLVTGGSSGIGKAICTRLAAQGHTVFGTTRKVGTQPKGYRLITMDLVDDTSVKHAVNEVITAAHRIDVVVNNAGLGIQGPTEDIQPEQAIELFDANLFGAHRVCRAVLPHMRANGSGLIINITSLAANFGLPYRGFYSASKAALERYTEALSMEVQPFGIHVVSLQPGEYKTNIGTNRIRPAVIGEAYKDGYDRAMEILGGSLHYSHDPDEVAVLVQKIMGTARPKSVYYAAHGLQRSAVLLKKLLPGRLFQRLMMREYR